MEYKGQKSIIIYAFAAIGYNKAEILDCLVCDNLEVDLHTKDSALYKAYADGQAMYDRANIDYDERLKELQVMRLEKVEKLKERFGL